MPWISRLLAAAFGAFLLCWVGPAHAQLSSQAQRDMIELRMIDAVKAEDYAAYLRHLDAFRRAGGQPEVDMRYYEAVALARAGDAIAARDILQEFVDRAGRGHVHYEGALRLLTEVMPAAVDAERRLDGLTVLLRALEEGKRRVSVSPMPAPSAWASYRTEPSYGLFSSEFHRGMVARPDGGWLSFGHKPLGETANRLPGLSDPRFPQATLERRDAAGRIQWTRAFDWESHAMLRLQPSQIDTLGVGLAIHPATGQGRVIGFYPGSPARRADLPWLGPQIGDVVTHVDGRALGSGDNVFTRMFAAGPTVRLRLARPGTADPIDVTVERKQGLANTTWLAPERRGAVEGARRLIGGAYPPNPDDLVGARHSWSSEVVAFVEDPDGEGGRICVNIDYGVWWDAHTQFGLWARVGPDGTLTDTPTWSMPADHPSDTADFVAGWYDSGLIDCVGLPDGSLLTVSRSVRVGAIAGNRRPVGADRGTLVYRIFGEDGGLRSSHRLDGDGAAVGWPPVDPEFGFARLKSVAGSDGWSWTHDLRRHGEQTVHARRGALTVEGGVPASRVVAHRSTNTGKERWEGLGVLGRFVRLLGSASGAIHGIDAVDRLPDGTLLVLVNVNLVPELFDVIAPDGLPFGAEVPEQDYLKGNFRSIGVLVAVDPEHGAEPKWAVLLRHGHRPPGEPYRTAFTSPKPSRLDDSGFAVSYRWSNLAVLADGRIAVQVPAGAGLLIRPGAGG